MHRIEIPNAQPVELLPDQIVAANLVIAAVREAGLDPRRAVDIPIMQGMAAEWVEGRWTRAQFIHACRNLLILNPALAPT